MVNFLAWDKNKKEFVHNVVISNSSRFATRSSDEFNKLVNDYYKSKGDILHGDYAEIDYTDWYAINDVEIFNNTRLKDCEGTEIFEGSILKSTLQGRLFNWIVSFNDGSYIVKNIGVDGYQETNGYQLDQSMAGMRRVIGHKCTHPELLKIPNI